MTMLSKAPKKALEISKTEKRAEEEKSEGEEIYLSD
jgi:hypothetical protein